MTKSNYFSIARELSSFNSALEGHPYDESIEVLQNKILTNQYKIAVVGDFSTGKSTFINALLGDELLYTSTKEATGVITTIQYDDLPHVQICKKSDNNFENQIVEDFELSNENNKIHLNNYLNIENKTTIDHVNIFYPITGVDRDIVFFDTPGIEKLSKEQMLMTKRVIAESNAVIFLITKKGFTEQALKVIASEHETIGKITTNNIMVVITHIGEIFDNRTVDEANAQINKVLNETKQQLLSKGIENVNIFPLDSRDYLWGTNKNVYEKEKLKRNVVLNGDMLTQEEYKSRSLFENFKAKLYECLDKDLLQKRKIEDIESTILLIAEDMQNEMEKQNESESLDNSALKKQIERQIEASCDNQRKFYNKLIRQLQDHMDDFVENVEKDSKKQKENVFELMNLIQRLFQKLDDINEENVKKCIEKAISDIESFAKKIEKETNNHIQITCDNFVRTMFSEQFQKIFDRSVDVQIKKPALDLNLVLNKDDYSESIINDPNIETMEKEKEEKLAIIQNLKSEIQLYTEKVNEKTEKLNKQKAEVESWYKTEIHKLGKKPKPVQKYTTIERSKGLLFWKKTWEEEVPDGMDDRVCIKWEQKQKNIFDTYDNKLSNLDEIEEELEQDKSIKKRKEDKLKDTEKILKSLNYRIDLQKKCIEDEKIKYTESYISEKKENVASYCETIQDNLIAQVIDSVKSQIYVNKKEIEKEIKTELSCQMKKYHDELEEKNRLLSDSIKMTEETKMGLLSRIKKIQEEIKNGQQV